jgi:hypothetical protein
MIIIRKLIKLKQVFARLTKLRKFLAKLIKLNQVFARLTKLRKC